MSTPVFSGRRGDRCVFLTKLPAAVCRSSYDKWRCIFRTTALPVTSVQCVCGGSRRCLSFRNPDFTFLLPLLHSISWSSSPMSAGTISREFIIVVVIIHSCYEYNTVASPAKQTRVENFATANPISILSQSARIRLKTASNLI